MTFSFEKKLILLFSCILIGIAGAGIVTFRDSESVNDTEHLVQHTRKVLYESENVLSLAKDIVLSTRGYVITGDSVFLKPFEDANEIVHKHITKLEELTEDNPVQQQRTDSLKKLIEKRIEISLLIIRSRKEKGFEHAQQLIASRKGKFYMDEIRNTVHAIQLAENKLLNEQLEANRESHAAFNRSFYFLLSTILLLLIIVLFTIRHNLQVRKKAEEELKASEEKFRNLINLSPVGITLSTASGKILETNPEILNMMGYATKEELMKTPVTEFFVDINDREKRLQLFKKDGYVKNYQSRLKRKDGRVIWVSGHVYPFKLNNGEMAMLSAQMNITEIKEAEDELFIKNEWYNQTLISLGDGVIATDVNGIITLINKAACELTGWTQEGAVGSHVDMVFEISNERTGLKVINPLMEALRENKIVLLANHTILKRKDGSKIFIDDSGAPIHNQKKELIGGVLIFRDITEKKKAEDNLSKLKRELEIILNSVRDGIHGINKDGIIIFENPAACQMLGWEQKDLIGKPAHATIHHTYPNGLPYPVCECSIYATLKDGIVRNEDNESFWRNDGTSFPVSYTSSPMRNEANEIIGAIVTFRDITEKKKAEEELLAYKNELEEKVNKRTLELSNAVKELKRNEEMLDETGRLAKVGGWEIDLANMNVVWTDEVYRIHELEKGKMPSVEEAINFYAPDAKPVIQEAVNKGIATGEGWDLDLPFVTANGNNLWVRAIGKTENKNGKVARVFGVFQDITERKKTEMEKIEYIASLEEMLFMISHKVRQPVANILGIANLLDNELITKEVLTKIAGYMKESSLNLDRFTHELTKLVSDAKSKTENKNWA